ncbi:GspH/FimT family pseudopilin [Amphritea japonica]|uniref:Type II secretion system protein H n=1 Tax=Amphritea japonica ATCC BAA-1530 TaxID=1278309 RepID=A0A7R6PE11_9GAMM|nr:GspH/FimT family pseudopilin [Amphritea japonica]BBB27728.1 type IV fimbrial biogenesis protein FimT [Amphritea japonica ATCC BAA-1530]
MNKQRGFTLIELMVVLAVAGILAGVVAPGFQEMIRNNRITADVNHFVAASHAARSEALKTGVPVILQPIANNWNNGWTVDETVSGGVNLMTFNKSSDIAINSALANIRYNSRGMTTTGNGVLQFCDSRVGETGRQITISLTGRVNTDEFACP